MDPFTPQQSPRELKCPSAPIKEHIKCDGCRMFLQGIGGENQAAHMGWNGCIDIFKLD